MCTHARLSLGANTRLAGTLLSAVAFLSVPGRVEAQDTVGAGPDQTVELAQGAALSGTAMAGHTVEWTVTSRPSASTVTFAGPAETSHFTYPDATTTAYFSRTGTYVLSFTDRTGGSSDDVQVTVVANPSSNGTVRMGRPFRLMPLGDSITDATPGWRFALQDLLSAGGYTVDFVGGRHLGHDDIHDPDHEGHSGWETVQYPQSMEFAWAGDDQSGYFIDMAGHQADVVLLMLGTNDMWRGYDPQPRAARLAQDIDDIYAKSPGCRIIVAMIPALRENPDHPATDEGVQQYNAYVPGIVDSRAASGKLISWVDMHSALQQGVDFSDGIHLNDSGNAKVAQVWYQGIVAVSDDAVPTAPSIVSTALTAATAGRTYEYNVDATGTPMPTYALTDSPAGMTINATNGVIMWTPSIAGSFEVSVIAANGVAADASQTFTIVVAEPSQPHVIGHWKLDESTGTVAADSSGNGNDGTLTAIGTRGRCAWQPDAGHAEGALDLDAWDDPGSNATEGYCVTVAHASTMDFSGGVTVSLWVNAARWGDTGYYWPHLASKGGQFRIESQEYNSLRFYVTPAGESEVYVASNHPIVNAWHHLAATYDGAQMRLYVDGAMVASRQQTGTIASASNDIIMGAQLGGEAKCFDGMLDDIHISGYALADSEVSALFMAAADGPSIVAQPSDAHVSEGGAAHFTITATGTGDLEHQWYENSSLVAGATDPSYSILTAAPFQSGHTYYCEVADDTGVATSDVATLTVGDVAARPKASSDPSMSCAAGTCASPAVLMPVFAMALLRQKRGSE